MSTIQIDSNPNGAFPVIQEATGYHGAARSAGSGRAPAPGQPVADRAPTPDLASRLPGVSDPDAVQILASEVQEALNRATPAPSQVKFRHDEVTNGFVIELRDPDGSLIRQYPPEKLLNLRHKLDELSGMVVDEMT